MSSSTQRIVKHSTIYAIGNILRQIASFIMLPIYTHFLSPADYGVVGLLTFAMSIAEAFFGARLGEAMPKYYFQEGTPRRKNAVISTAFIITAASSAVYA
jgi:O-antigen/teichoic acid export membrane protein